MGRWICENGLILQDDYCKVRETRENVPINSDEKWSFAPNPREGIDYEGEKARRTKQKHNGQVIKKQSVVQRWWWIGEDR